jgi:ABC-2 type transport system ATP-binding protein
MTAIEVEHLVKRFGSFAAVEDVSFDVPVGQVAAALGPNGADKTIEILEGFLAIIGRPEVLFLDPGSGRGRHDRAADHSLHRGGAAARRPGDRAGRRAGGRGRDPGSALPGLERVP